MCHVSCVCDPCLCTGQSVRSTGPLHLKIALRTRVVLPAPGAPVTQTTRGAYLARFAELSTSCAHGQHPRGESAVQRNAKRRISGCKGQAGRGFRGARARGGVGQGVRTCCARGRAVLRAPCRVPGPPGAASQFSPGTPTSGENWVSFLRKLALEVVNRNPKMPFPNTVLGLEENRLWLRNLFSCFLRIQCWA